MNSKSFSTTITVPNSPQDVFARLQQVSKWWGKEDFAGNCAQLHDEFTINHPGTHFSKHQLIEVIPGEKIVWLTTESKMPWLVKDDEWTDTKMIFEIAAAGDDAVLRFTHEGLVPELECFTACSKGWTMVITDWFYKYVTGE